MDYRFVNALAVLLNFLTLTSADYTTTGTIC